jgi:hypothetical protein
MPDVNLRIALSALALLVGAFFFGFDTLEACFLECVALAAAGLDDFLIVPWAMAAVCFASLIAGFAGVVVEGRLAVELFFFSSSFRLAFDLSGLPLYPNT